jgi:hypothetical protein
MTVQKYAVGQGDCASKALVYLFLLEQWQESEAMLW